jgi:hypothetical protein
MSVVVSEPRIAKRATTTKIVASAAKASNATRYRSGSLG